MLHTLYYTTITDTQTDTGTHELNRLRKYTHTITEKVEKIHILTKRVKKPGNVKTLTHTY